MNKKPYEIIIELSDQHNQSIEQVITKLIENQYLTVDPDNPQITPSPLGYASGCFDSTGVTTELQIIETTDTHTIGIAYYEGKLCRFRRDLKTDQVMMDADCLANVLGYKDAHELLSQDESLDALTKVKKKLVCGQ